LHIDRSLVWCNKAETDRDSVKEAVMAFDFGTGLRGALSGAGAGLQLGPWGAAGGALLGLLGGFGKSPEEEYAEREKYLIDRAKEIYGKIMRQGVSDITSSTASLASKAGQGGARVARSLGREGQIAAYTTPAISDVRAQGERSLRDYILGINRAEQEAELGASQAYTGRPIQPSIADILGAAGPAIGQGIGQYKVNEALRKYYGIDDQQPADLSGLDIGVSRGTSPGFALTPGMTPGVDLMKSYRSELYGPTSVAQPNEVPQQTLDLSSMLMGAGQEPNWLFPRRRNNYGLPSDLNRPMKTRPRSTLSRVPRASGGYYLQPEDMFSQYGNF
jgi:hypothetical protein